MRRLVIGLAALCAAGGASAQTAIGEMADIVRQVSGSFGGRTVALRNTDRVVQNEVLATGADSMARVAFHDLTSVSMGPQATIKLDRFVYNPDSTASQVTLGMAKGAFRFVTGSTKSENFRIRTPQATIGVRGTVVDIWVRPGREIVVLRQGSAWACKGAACVNIVQPDTGVIITAAGIQGPTPMATAEFNFDVFTLNRFTLYRHPALGNPLGGNGDTQAGYSSSSSSSSSSTSRQ
ncbi:MAG TPA: FecR domain-containing protein [Beijerinckiaceae bacterium]|nr:FecR domain-containing protein [Beijerinckiaceae bacterium]